MSKLEELVGAAREDVERRKTIVAVEQLREAVGTLSGSRPFSEALVRPGLSLIAEFKRRSPSAGDIAGGADVAQVCAAYERGGAAALSVLTDRPYFGGSVADMQVARDATGLPVLRKDFTIDEIQVYEARAIGADAVLLICAALPDDALLADLHALARELGMSALVETHDAAEIDRALGAAAEIVGVNSRDLATFSEDLDVAAALASRVPAGVIAVAESAIRSADDARRMADAGFDAVLVGEALVRADDPTALVRDLAAVPVTRRA